MEPVAPEEEGILGLTAEMGLMEEHDRHEPGRIRERHQTACAARIGEVLELLEKGLGCTLA
jgi:hypothetical protein